MVLLETLGNYILYGSPKNFRYKFDDNLNLFVDNSNRIYLPDNEKENIINEYITDIRYTAGPEKLYHRLKKVFANITIQEIRNEYKKNREVQILAKHKHKHSFKPITTSGPNKIAQIDLIDMQKLSKYNKGARYILTVIDIFSKKADAIGLKDKTTEKVIEGMIEIMNRNKDFTFKKIQCDNGSEFKGQFEQAMKDEFDIDVFHSSPYNPASQGIVENFNGSLKKLLNIHMNQTDTKNWIDVLHIAIANHNDTIHTATGYSPNEIYQLDNEGIKKVHDRIMKRTFKTHDHSLRVGDVVRISLKTRKEERKKTLEKNPIKWSDELYSIFSITEPDMKPSVFTLYNWYNRRVMKKKFYEHQLLKSSLPNGNDNIVDYEYDGRFHVIEL